MFRYQIVKDCSSGCIYIYANSKYMSSEFQIYIYIYMFACEQRRIYIYRQFSHKIQGLQEKKSTILIVHKLNKNDWKE